ncbi:MAG TPA: MaoC family dehydratase [Blastocatellia bacterium]|jgi:acyl dehydratase|nr:MaoC family dehydratase [Blastocatellia bacterium]
MPARVIEGVEELKGLIGQEVGASEWLEITQSRINDFAETTEDRQWIHLDAERARASSPFKTTIAHGFLTLSLLSHFASEAVAVKGDFKMGINYGLNRVRFVSPVTVGSRVRGRFTLQSVEEVQGGLQLVWNITVEVENAPKPALAAEWLVRYYV